MDWAYMISPVPLSSYHGSPKYSITIFVVKVLMVKWDHKGGTLIQRVSVLMKRDIKKLASSGSMCTQEDRPHEDLERKWLPASGKESHRNWTLWDLDPGLTLRTWRKRNYLLFEAPCLWYFCWVRQARMKLPTTWRIWHLPSSVYLLH